MVRDRIGDFIDVDWQNDLFALQPDNVKLPYNVEHLKNSILKHGFSFPFAVWSDNGKYYTIDGHTRKDALIELVAEGVEVPTKLKAFEIKAKDRNEAVTILVEVFNQKHNPFAEEILIEWLQTEEVDVEELNMDSVNIAFDESGEEKKIEAEEDDFDEAPPEIPITVLGDLYEIGEHRLLCGDSTDSDQVARLMNGEKADMVFTDPPYGVSYEGGHNKKKRNGIIADELQGEHLSSLFEDSINTACIFSKDSAPFYIWYAGGKSKETYLGLSKTPIEVRAVICWYKIKSGSGAFMSQYIPNYEPCIYGHKQGKVIQWFGPTDEKTVWEFKKDNVNDFHPTQKPIDVVERALNNSSSKHQLIYDAFGGSGSTMVGSHQLLRKAYLMELDPKYCDVIVKRMITLDPTLTIKRNGEDVTKHWIEKL